MSKIFTVRQRPSSFHPSYYRQVRGLRCISRCILTPVCGAESSTVSCRPADMYLNTACHTNRPSHHSSWRSPRQYWVHLRSTPRSQLRTGTYVRRTSARSRRCVPIQDTRNSPLVDKRKVINCYLLLYKLCIIHVS